jgi:hypothetical protein
LGAGGDPGAPTINVTNVECRPLGGAGAIDPGASTINAKKCRRRAPWEVPALEIWERPPSTVRNVDGGAPWEVPELYIQKHTPSTLRNIDDRPLEGAGGDPEASTINVTNIEGGPPRC